MDGGGSTQQHVLLAKRVSNPVHGRTGFDWAVFGDEIPADYNAEYTEYWTLEEV